MDPDEESDDKVFEEDDEENDVFGDGEDKVFEEDGDEDDAFDDEEDE